MNSSRQLQVRLAQRIPVSHTNIIFCQEQATVISQRVITWNGKTIRFGQVMRPYGPSLLTLTTCECRRQGYGWERDISDLLIFPESFRPQIGIRKFEGFELPATY